MCGSEIYNSEKTCFDFNNVIPYPNNFLEQDKKYNKYQELKEKKKLTSKEKKELIVMELKREEYQKDGYKIHPSEYVKFLYLIIM
jgi:hypothetical protein